ncbi:MAG: hypothetical protein K1W34_12645 [Lachnospiraceae bacterium]
MVDNALDFYYYRKPQANPKVKWERKPTFLWRPEPGRISEGGLKQQVSELLFERDYNEIAGMSEDYCNPLDITR